ncbi:MAG: hypothetical protein Q8N03_10285 [Ignavibacteria bacterium]|nr:hypothetical protein [Ignavibacteria bacterium]MDP3831449.1 hypothetical protein [Ignavibacteriaceae bacterium]
MSFRDQKKYIEELKRYDYKIKGKDDAEFKMLLKRHKDEEEFDTVSLSKAKSLYEKYCVSAVKKNYDHFFKKPDDPQ